MDPETSGLPAHPRFVPVFMTVSHKSQRWRDAPVDFHDDGFGSYKLQHRGSQDAVLDNVMAATVTYFLSGNTVVPVILHTYKHLVQYRLPSGKLT